MTCKRIQDYIDLVRSGKIAVCEEQFLLCKLVEKIFSEENLTVNEKQLEDYLKLQKYFPFQLLNWEIFCFALHNCVYKENGQLRWPILFIYVGRGAGKNGYLAFEDFCLLTPINGIKHYDIDIFAMSEDQAKTTFEDVYNVLEENESKLKNHFYWTKEVIINYRTKSRLRFRTSGIKTKDGGRPGKIDFDEWHAYENYKIVDTSTTGLGKKPHPRRTVITTDGDVREGPLDDWKAKGQAILRGEIADNGMLPFFCKLDKIEEIMDKSMWPKANPSLPYFPWLQHELDIEFSDYITNPIGNSSFATKRMNMPQGNKDIEVTSWDNILATKQDLPELEGLSAVVGIDYSKITDFASADLHFRVGETRVDISHSWLCLKSADLPKIKAPYMEWAERELITLVDDVEISPELIVAWIDMQAQKYNLKKLALDNYRYALLASALKASGWDAKEHKNVYIVRPSDIMKVVPVIDSCFANQKFIWGDNPVLRWAANNTKLIKASKKIGSDTGNYYYGKIEAHSRKTDPFMAVVHAMCIENELDDGISNIVMDMPVYTF